MGAWPAPQGPASGSLGDWATGSLQAYGSEVKSFALSLLFFLFFIFSFRERGERGKGRE